MVPRCAWVENREGKKNRRADFNNLQGISVFPNPHPLPLDRGVCVAPPRGGRPKLPSLLHINTLRGAAPWRTTAGRSQTPSRRLRAARAPASPANDHFSPATYACVPPGLPSVANTIPERRPASRLSIRAPGVLPRSAPTTAVLKLAATRA